jgi:glucose/arabinose dehydrogenase
MAALLLCAGSAQAQSYPAGFEEQVLVSGLTQPMAVDWTPDGRTLVLEKPGVLKVAMPGSQAATTVFDFRSRVNENHDRGALGLAVDADFATNRFVYLLYTYDVNPLSPDSGGEMVSQLLRVTLSPTNRVADETVLLGSYTSGKCPTAANNVDCIPSDYDSHSIGTVRSAPDGTLYLGSGDGASYNAADVRALRAYDEQSMAGKILHIDRNGRGLPGHPFCPSNTNLSDVCTKVFARGLRNPFRFALRSGGGLTVGDVGWNTTEEINIVPAGGGRSYGWPCYEGTARTGGYSSFSQCQVEYNKPAGTHSDPDVSWCHCGQSASVLGGPVYEGGGSYPHSYDGTTFYGDYVQAFVRNRAISGASANFASGWYGYVDIETEPSGDLAFVNVGDFGPGSGVITALHYTAADQAPIARIVADKTSGVAPLTVSFDGTTSSDPDGDPLTYKWEFGDGTTSTAAKPSKTFAQAGTFPVKLTADDGRGRTGTVTQTITAGNSAPTATISTPDNAPYRDGVPVTLGGSGSDPQDGALPAAALSWRVVLVHGDHQHIETQLTGSAPVLTPRSDHDADSYYEVTLTVTDSGGLTGSRTIRLRPETVPLSLASVPAGAPLVYAGRTVTAPFSATAAIGFRTAVDAPPSFLSGGKTYVFDGWSDGGAASHAVTIPATPLSLTATYHEFVPSSLVAAFNFDEGAGSTAADKSGSGNTATLSGGAGWSASGRTGAAANFDGANAIATVADSPSLRLTGPLTLEAWVRPRSRTAWRTVIFKALPGWQSYVLYGAADPYDGLGAGGEPVGFVDGDGIRGPAPLPLSAWSHLAMTYDGAVQRLYVDGSLVASAPRTGGITTGAGALTIGRNGVWGEAFDGLVDDVRVYGRALTASEIAADRDTPVGGGVTPPPAGPVPVAAYSFEETSGTTTADTSPNAAVAQVSGPTRTTSGKLGSALDFDGVNDRVIVPDAPQLRLSSAMTLSAWVRPDSTTGWRTVLLKETGDFQSYALYASADPYEGGNAGDPTGFAYGTGVRGPAKLPTAAWTHLALTYDGLTERLYVGGVLVSQRAATVTPPFSSAPLSIGGNGVWGEWFDGRIDEVRLFGTALSATQIAADRDRTSARAATVRARGFSLSRRTVRRGKPALKRAAPKRRKVLRGSRAKVRAPRHRSG